MKRLLPKEKEIIKKLARRGLSINSICKKIKLKKSTVYYWFRKFVGKKIRKVKINEDLEEEIGEIIGAFAGDGNFYLDKNYQYKIRFYLSGDEKQYAMSLIEKLKKVYGKVATLMTYKNVIIVQIIGKDIISHFNKFITWNDKKTYTVKLLNSPKEYSTKFLKGFCRGLFDTDGWINKNNLMINCYSDELMKNLSESLNILNIPHILTIWKRKNKEQHFAIFLNNENTVKFFKTIGSSNPKRKMRAPTGI